MQAFYDAGHGARLAGRFHMSATDYLGDSFNPATDYLGDDFSTSTNFLDADDVIGAVFAEDEEFGVNPSDVFGEDDFVVGRTPAVRNAVLASKSLQAQSKRSAAQAPRAQPQMRMALQQNARESAIKSAKIRNALKQSAQRRQQMIRSLGRDAAAGAMGAGELDYSVKSPPGIGRLQTIQFNVTAPANNALCVVGDQPVVIAAGVAAGQQTLQTPQMPWAVIRLVGVMIHRVVDNPGAGVPDVYFLQGLATGNGTPLFLVNGVNNANFYLAGLELRGGLRDYPIVRAPNQLDIIVSWQNGVAAAVTTAGTTIINVEALVEVLADDDYGAHLPSPFARTDALMRKPVGRI